MILNPKKALIIKDFGEAGSAADPGGYFRSRMTGYQAFLKLKPTRDEIIIWSANTSENPGRSFFHPANSCGLTAGCIDRNQREIGTGV